MSRKAALVVFVGLLAALPAGEALSFGPVSHSTMSYHASQYLGAPPALLLQAFIAGSNGPDALSLYPHNLSHNLEVAEIMLELAETEAQAALAYGYGAHILEDLAGHGTCLPCCEPEDEIPQVIAEFSVDYHFYHSDDPGESQTGHETTVLCDAQLLSDAVALYNDRHGHPFADIAPELIEFYCDGYALVIEAEKALYDDMSWADYADRNEPLCWREECVNEGITDTVDWILAHPHPLVAIGPVPKMPEPDTLYPFESADTDGDDVPDCGVRDNCLEIWNPDQTDVDTDGFGAACDCDDNDPGVNPGVEESRDAGNCGDGVDNDCDGIIDGGPGCT